MTNSVHDMGGMRRAKHANKNGECVTARAEPHDK